MGRLIQGALERHRIAINPTLKLIQESFREELPSSSLLLCADQAHQRERRLLSDSYQEFHHTLAR